jgi:hypothetical protein
VSKKRQWVGVGSFLAKITERMGITPCEPCERRKQALDNLVPRLYRIKSDCHGCGKDQVTQSSYLRSRR